MVYQIGSACLLVAVCALTFWAVRLKNELRRLHVEHEQLKTQLEDAIKRLAAFDREPKSKRFNKLVDLLVAAGVPGLIFVGAVAVSGFSGAAAITTALAALGGPMGMVGGITGLILLAAVLSQCSILDVSKAVVRRLLQTKSKATIEKEINLLPRIIPEKFRVRAKALLENA